MPRVKIFAKERLSPTQLRTVADRRLGDAQALLETRKNARANGAIYLAGFVIECLLKAKLLERFPWLQNAGSPVGRSKSDGYLWSLCYRSHDLTEILVQVPMIEENLANLERRKSNSLVQSLKSICGRWTIHARYSPHTADIRQAEGFLRQIKELKAWLM